MYEIWSIYSIKVEAGRPRRCAIPYFLQPANLWKLICMIQSKIYRRRWFCLIYFIYIFHFLTLLTPEHSAWPTVADAETCPCKIKNENPGSVQRNSLAYLALDCSLLLSLFCLNRPTNWVQSSRNGPAASCLLSIVEKLRYLRLSASFSALGLCTEWSGHHFQFLYHL